MEEPKENWVTHQNGWNPHLKYHLPLKTKQGAVWDFKGEEGNSCGDGKATIW